MILLLAMLSYFYADAQIINIPADYPSIQEGIEAAQNGDTVLVQPGTYVENINFEGKNITVASLHLLTSDITYIKQTIIDGDSSASVVVFWHDEDSTAVLHGFTITNGFTEYGAGIYISGTSPTLEHLIIKDNLAYWDDIWQCGHGGGIGCYSTKSRYQE